MSFRQRLTLAAAIAVAIAVALASALAYVLVRNELRGQVDDALSSRAAAIQQISLPPGLAEPEYLRRLPHNQIGNDIAYQLVGPTGDSLQLGYTKIADLPVTARTEQVASGKRGPFAEDVRVDGLHLRMLTVQLAPGLALQLVRSLDEVDHVLGRLGLVLALVAAAGIGVAVALGGIVAAAALRPVRRLSEITEHVAATRDLSQRLEERGRDELGRLAHSFNTMMAALEDSQRAQRQLVADASHELRTPLTALRTNVELLATDSAAAADDNRRVMQDVVGQLEELTVLVGDLVELARGSEQRELETEDVRLDMLVSDAVMRARRNAPQVRFETSLEESLVRGVPSRIDRAVANLLDNAAKWSAPGGVVEVRVSGGELTVRDHGPGIPEADRPFVFDRFYRAKGARGMPGSGLGLAIVRQVAETHGGSVSVEQPEGGGSLFRLRFPLVDRGAAVYAFRSA